MPGKWVALNVLNTLKSGADHATLEQWRMAVHEIHLAIYNVHMMLN